MSDAAPFDPARRFLDWLDAPGARVDGQFLRLVLLCMPERPAPGAAELVIHQLQDQARALRLSMEWNAPGPADAIRTVMHRTIDSLEALCQSR